MQIQFNKSAIQCLETLLQEVQNAEVTQEVRLPEGMPDIGRILTTWGQVLIRSKEWHGSEVMLTGGVKTWTLYAPEDGTEPRSVESWLPFQLVWKVDMVDREGPVRMIPLLRFADSRSISSRKMIVRTGVTALAQALHPKMAEIYQSGDLPEDIEILKKTYPLRVPVESGEKTFLIDEEFALPESTESVEKLLGMMVWPEITEKRTISDKIVFKGNLAMHLVCRNQEGRIRSFDLSHPFSQLSELDKSYGPEEQADIQMAVTSLDADLGEGGKVRVKCGLTAQYLLDDCLLLELVEDAYSPYREVSTVEDLLQLPVVGDELSELMQAEVTVPGQEGISADAVFLPDFPRMRRGPDGQSLELPGMFQSLVYGEHDALQGFSARWEGNKQFGSDGNGDWMTTVQPEGSVRTVLTSEGLNLSAPLHVRMMPSWRQNIPMVVALEVGAIQEQDPTRPSVIICGCEGRSLWELAKENGSTVSAIRSANPVATDGSEGLLLIPVL